MLYPGSQEYKALRFGGVPKNLLAIRTYGCDKRFEDAALDVGKVLVKAVFKIGHRNGFADRAGGEKPVQQNLLVGLQAGPFGAVFF